MQKGNKYTMIIDDWKTWKPKNDYEFYMFQISKLYIAGIISTKECNRRIEKLKTIYNINKERN